MLLSRFLRADDRDLLLVSALGCLWFSLVFIFAGWSLRNEVSVQQLAPWYASKPPPTVRVIRNDVRRAHRLEPRSIAGYSGEQQAFLMIEDDRSGDAAGQNGQGSQGSVTTLNRDPQHPLEHPLEPSSTMPIREQSAHPVGAIHGKNNLPESTFELIPMESIDNPVNTNQPGTPAKKNNKLASEIAPSNDVTDKVSQSKPTKRSGSKNPPIKVQGTPEQAVRLPIAQVYRAPLSTRHAVESKRPHVARGTERSVKRQETRPVRRRQIVAEPLKQQRQSQDSSQVSLSRHRGQEGSTRPIRVGEVPASSNQSRNPSSNPDPAPRRRNQRESGAREENQSTVREPESKKNPVRRPQVASLPRGGSSSLRKDSAVGATEEQQRRLKVQRVPNRPTRQSIPVDEGFLGNNRVATDEDEIAPIPQDSRPRLPRSAPVEIDPSRSVQTRTAMVLPPIENQKKDTLVRELPEHTPNEAVESVYGNPFEVRLVVIENPAGSTLGMWIEHSALERGTLDPYCIQELERARSRKRVHRLLRETCAVDRIEHVQVSEAWQRGRTSDGRRR